MINRKTVILLSLLILSLIFNGFQYALLSSYQANVSTTTFTAYSTITYTVTSTSIAQVGVEVYPKKIVDFMGREVVIEKKPLKIVSCAPSITEMLAYLGLLDKIVGVDSYSDYPSELITLKQKGKIEDVGGVVTLSIEKIISLSPDIVFIDAGLQGNYAAILEEKGLKVVALHATSVTDIYKGMILIGDIMGLKEKTLEVVNHMRNTLSNLHSKLNFIREKVSVLYVGWIEPIWTAGRNTFIDDLIGAADGYNVMVDAEGFFMTNPETIVAKNPQVIIVLSTMHGMSPEEIIAKLRNIPGIDKVDAVKNERIYLLYNQAENIFARPGPRAHEAVEILAKILYPELFKVKIPNVLGDDYRKYLEYSSGYSISILEFALS